MGSIDSSKSSAWGRLLGYVLSGVILLGSAQAWAATPLKVAYSSIAGVTAVPWIAVERGIFAKYGIDVELIYLAGSQPMQSLLGGTTPIVLQGIEPVINTNAQGADTVMIGGLVNTAVFSLVVRPEIKELKDLKGRPLGITRYGSSTDFVLRYALEKWGLKPDYDVPILQMGGVPLILVGMETKKIYGGPLSLPTLARATQAGFREIIDLSDVIPAYQVTGVVARRSFIKDQEEVVRSFLKGITEAIAVFKNDAAYTKKILQEKIKIQDRMILEETYKRYSRYISRVPYPTRPGIALIKTTLEEKNPAIRKLSIDDLIDTRFVRELEQSGFIDALYRPR